LEFLDGDRAVQPRIAGTGDFIRQDSDFDRFPDFVAAMINRIYHGFFQGGVRNFEKTVGFRPIIVLYDAFFNDRVLQECQCVFEDHVQGTGEGLLRKNPRPKGGALDCGLQRRPKPSPQRGLGKSRCPGLFIIG
jgi:hypothetical protein